MGSRVFVGALPIALSGQLDTEVAFQWMVLYTILGNNLRKYKQESWHEM